MSNFSSIWNDPVWSKVIAAGIIVCAGFVADLLKKLFGQASLLWAMFGIFSAGFYIIAIGLIISLLIYIYIRHTKKKEDQKKSHMEALADKFVKNKMFCDIFLNKKNAESVFKRIGHTPEAKSLMSDLNSENLLERSETRYPKLNEHGKLLIHHLLSKQGL